MKTIASVVCSVLLVFVFVGTMQAEQLFEDFEGWSNGTIVWGQQVGDGPRFNSSGYNQSTNQTAPSMVYAGQGVGGSNGLSSAVGAQGSANVTIPASAWVDNKLTVQVDVNPTGLDGSGHGDLSFALGTDKTWNEGATGDDLNFFGFRMRHISDVGVENMVGGSHDFLRVRQINGELSMGVGGHIGDGWNVYNAQSAGWVQAKIEVDNNTGNAGVFIRDIDDTTGAAIGPWSGGYWKTTSAGAMGANSGFFWQWEGTENMVINLLSQGGQSNVSSLYDNLVIGAAGGGTASFAGDFDDDGDVDGDDFLAWQNSFPTASGAAKSGGDADGDGDVDGDDFLIWQNQFPSPGAVAATPEPASLALLGLGGLLMLRRRRA